MISRGKVGPVVRELQGNLCGHGLQIQVDGIFGSQTETAVRSFQQRVGLPADGVAGTGTWNALHGVSGTPRRGVERPAPTDWGFLDHLRSAGVWLEEYNPVGGKSAAAPAGASRAPSTSGPSPARSAPTPPAQPNAPQLHLATATSSRARRMRFDSYAGRAWVVSGYDDLLNKQVHEIGGGRFAVNPVGAKRLFHNNECVALVKYFGLPRTAEWRRGPQVSAFKPGELPVGTVVATLRDGSYHSDYSGRSHVGIYAGHDDHSAWMASHDPTAGVQLVDQWNGALIRHSPTKRYAVNADAMGRKSKKAWRDSAGKVQTNRVSWTSDGEEYFVVMTA